MVTDASNCSDITMTFSLNVESGSVPPTCFAPIRRVALEQTAKLAYMDGTAENRSTNDALRLVYVWARAATAVSGRTGMAEQPGTATVSKESTPLPS